MLTVDFRPRGTRAVASLAGLACLLMLLVLSACGGAAPTGVSSRQNLDSAPAQAPGVAPSKGQGGAPAAQPTAAPPAALPAQPPPETQPGGGSSGPSLPANVAPIDRKIIKNAQISMIVDSTATGVQKVTAIAADVGGYVVGSRTFAEARGTGAQVTISVPVDRFEEALNLVRKVARELTSDQTSSSDASDQYVDLQARLKNLQATADRIRAFLDKAATVEEALKVNQQLSDVESQIEQIKGKLNALDARTSFSTITVDMHEPVPTPTPTFTPTPTPTPTPVGWHPDQTFGAAVQFQSSLLQLLGNILIWLIVVLLPYALAFFLVAYALTWLIRRFVRPAPPPRAQKGSE